MRKFAYLLFAFLLVTASVNAQSKKWKEMDEFHTVIGETFHPAEEGKLGPVKARSQELVDKALAWVRSEAPEGVNRKEFSAGLKDLLRGTKELHKLVTNQATDKQITDQLTLVHDTFHQLEEKFQHTTH